MSSFFEMYRARSTEEQTKRTNLTCDMKLNAETLTCDMKLNAETLRCDLLKKRSMIVGSSSRFGKFGIKDLIVSGKKCCKNAVYIYASKFTNLVAFANMGRGRYHSNGRDARGNPAGEITRETSCNPLSIVSSPMVIYHR
jgi:hypothetical protein